MKRILLIFMLAAAAFSLDARKLTILHMNDTHSHIEPERNGEQAGRGGVIEQAAIVDSVRRADGRRNVLLLHAGDFSQGSSYFTILKGDLEISVLNAMGFDVVCLGHHEFDNGTDELPRRLANLQMPVVCSNYSFEGGVLGSLVKPYTVLRKAGKKIGFVSMLTDLTYVVARNVADTFKYMDPASSVSRYATLLKEELGCDLVICLSHCGWDEDLECAKSLKNVDVIVGGHSHTYIKEPAAVRSSDGKNIIIVQDGSYGLQVGNLKVDL